MSLRVETTIVCSAEKAFDLMADARNEPQWNSKVSRSELEGDGPIGRGSRFTVVNRGKEYDAVIETYERPSALRVEVAGAPMDITATLSFAADSEGTRLTGEFDMRPKGSMKLLFPLLKPMIRTDLQKQFGRFKVFCEGIGGGAAATAT
jgi:polyketide cyclase/dehydrase/lipid transport protein